MSSHNDFGIDVNKTALDVINMFDIANMQVCNIRAGNWSVTILKDGYHVYNMIDSSISERFNDILEVEAYLTNK